METGWWDAPLTLRDLAEVTRKTYTNSRHSQILLFLAACVRSKVSLSISPATQDNLEPILLLCCVDQHQKQKDEVLESLLLSPLNITRNLPLCYLTVLPLFPPCHLTTTFTHLLHLPSLLPSPLSHLPSSVLSHLSQLTTLPTTNRSLQNRNVPPPGKHGKHVWLIVRQLFMKAGWWDPPLAFRDLAEAVNMIFPHPSKHSYNNNMSLHI